MSVRQIYLVGHCGSDAFALKLAIEKATEGRPPIDVRTAVDTDDDVLNAAGDVLLLINRQLGNVLRRTTGVELIRQLAQRDDPPRMMLITNFEDAQQEAINAGAFPGFGKTDIHKPETKAKLQAALGGE